MEGKSVFSDGDKLSPGHVPERLVNREDEFRELVRLFKPVLDGGVGVGRVRVHNPATGEGLTGSGGSGGSISRGRKRENGKNGTGGEVSRSSGRRTPGGEGGVEGERKTGGESAPFSDF